MQLRPILFALLILLTPAALQAGKNIFDDDWVAPKSTERPTTPKPIPAPPRTPEPATTPDPTRPPDPAPTVTPSPTPEIKTIIVSAKRLPVPASAEQTAVRKVMKEVFATQLTDRTPAGRKKLITALIAQADKSADVPTERFVLLAAAHDAAIEAVDLPQALRFADEMGRFFEVDALAVKAAAVPTLIAKPQASRDATLANVRAALELATELTAAEDYNAATKICQSILPAANADADLRTQVQTQLREITALRDAAGKIAKDMEKLKAAPDDPAANLAVGRYQCFLKNDWPAGLRLLAKGSDVELKTIAAQELAATTEPGAVVRLADGWWNIAGKQSDSVFKSATTAHAATLYSSVLSNLSGLQRELANRRIADAAKIAPTGRSVVGSAVRTVITIAGNKSWQNVFEVRVGDVLTFAATGQVVTSPKTRPPTDPDGQPSKLGRPWGCLKGRVGNDSLHELFTIGSAKRHVVGRDGMLSLRADDNDNGFNDNSGEFKVIIDRQAAPKAPMGDGSDRFVLPATDIICRTLKAGTYEISAEGEWSMSPDGELYGPDGTGGARNLIIKQDEGHLRDIGKGTKLTLAVDTILPFKIREYDNALADNRGSVTVTIKPVK